MSKYFINLCFFVVSGKPNCTHFVGGIKRWQYNFDFRYLFRKFQSCSIDESDMIKILINGRETKNLLIHVLVQQAKRDFQAKKKVFNIFVHIN